MDEEEFLDGVIVANPKEFKELQTNLVKMTNFLVGQVMKLDRNLDVKAVKKTIMEKLLNDNFS